MNILAYIIYLLLTYFITVKVGLIFFRNGRLFILALMKNDTAITDAINKILLVGYYLVNLGYAALMISTWHTVIDWTDLLLSTTTKTGQIVLTLALLHYNNLGVILLISKRQKHFIHS